MKKKLTLLLLLSLAFWSCNSDEYSPNQVFNRRTATETNKTQLARLQPKPVGSPVRIAFSGDTQRSYEEAQQFVNQVNARNDIDFVMLNGDISDFGLLFEMDFVHDIYNKLKVPFITIVGNHDLVANGKAVYEHMFGPRNFTFTYAGIKFVCHDTNGREYDFDGTTPDLNWLRANLTLGNGETNLVAVSHVPSIDGDFDPALKTPYEQLLNQTSGMIASLHSHQHAKLKTYYANGTGIPFIVTNAIVQKAYTIIDIQNGQIAAHEIIF